MFFTLFNFITNVDMYFNTNLKYIVSGASIIFTIIRT
jgi:hypothetical protein